MGALMEQRESAVTADDQQTQYLTFMLGSETFAIAIGHIKEIIEYSDSGLTTVPMMPDFIRGVINVRGSVLPVIDLRLRFGHQASPITKRTCIVILEVGADDEAQDIGVMVDQVNEVLGVEERDLNGAPSFGTSIRADFISGMARIEGQLVVILDVGKVLSVDEIALLAQAGDAG
ncbi:MAG: chemotaxis protein CheW [Gammaproteobacteria bacterium]|nr:chemotaxis protein CheW [Gammaproteobacteria bacterium]